ncbi:MAG TPA: transposase [Paludibacter sp.]|nr:transposase [Paludibacter sp.]
MLFKDEIPAELANELFSDSEKALQFIADIKWKDGFACRKCGHTNYCEGKTPSSRRCTRCKSEESATAHTLFHNIKFPVNKAFYIAYHVCVLGKDFSSYNYSDMLGLNQMTCWKFRKRIKECILKLGNNKNNIPMQKILMSTEEQ